MDEVLRLSVKLSSKNPKNYFLVCEGDMSKYFKVFISVIAMLSCQVSIASCSLSGGSVFNASFNFIQTKITIGADMPNGTVISSQSSRPLVDLIAVKCTTAGDISIVRKFANGSILTPSGFAGEFGGDVYKTNVPGVGFYMFSTGKPFNNGGVACRESKTCSRDSLSFFVGLNIVKIGDVVPGSVLRGSDLPCINMTMGQSDSMVNVLNSCFTGTLAVENLTCNTPTDVPVAMGTHEVRNFTGINSVSNWQDASIKLTQCPPFYGSQASGWIYSDNTRDQVSSVLNSMTLTLTPTGPVLDATNGIIKLSDDSTAAGVGIQLASGSSSGYSLVNFSDSTQANITLLNNTSQSNVTIPLMARYIQTDQNIIPGTANGKVIYTINYY